MRLLGFFRIQLSDYFFLSLSRFGDANVIRLNRKASIAAIDKDGEFDLARTANGIDFRQSGSDGSTRENDVVHQNDDRLFGIVAELRRFDFLSDRVDADVVPVEGDIDDGLANGWATLFHERLGEHIAKT